MPSASALRVQIEQALEHRFPAALTPVPRTFRETASTGIAAIDRLLDGGLPVGAISEITGAVSSGRTSMAQAFVGARTQEDRVCAWVDVHDAFDAESAAANGVDLRRLLWVRCKCASGSMPKWSHLDQALRATDLLLQTGGFAALVLDLGSTAPAQGMRIPLATWFRFRQAADRARCSLLVLAEEPLAQSSAAVVLECTTVRSGMESCQTVLRGCSYQIRTGRDRNAHLISGLTRNGHTRDELDSTHAATRIGTVPRKPPVADWTARGVWEQEAHA